VQAGYSRSFSLCIPAPFSPLCINSSISMKKRQGCHLTASCHYLIPGPKEGVRAPQLKQLLPLLQLGRDPIISRCCSHGGVAQEKGEG
jgi:hypothetical protein